MHAASFPIRTRWDAGNHVPTFAHAALADSLAASYAVRSGWRHAAQPSGAVAPAAALLAFAAPWAGHAHAQVWGRGSWRRLDGCNSNPNLSCWLCTQLRPGHSNVSVPARMQMIACPPLHTPPWQIPLLQAVPSGLGVPAPHFPVTMSHTPAALWHSSRGHLTPTQGPEVAGVGRQSWSSVQLAPHKSYRAPHVSPAGSSAKLDRAQSGAWATRNGNPIPPCPAQFTNRPAPWVGRALQQRPIRAHVV